MEMLVFSKEQITVQFFKNIRKIATSFGFPQKKMQEN